VIPQGGLEKYFNGGVTDPDPTEAICNQQVSVVCSISYCRAGAAEKDNTTEKLRVF
jgi:hypothetical protein